MTLRPRFAIDIHQEESQRENLYKINTETSWLITGVNLTLIKETSPVDNRLTIKPWALLLQEKEEINREQST